MTAAFIVDPATIYSCDNGRLLCGRHLLPGDRTGFTSSGLLVEPLTQHDIDEHRTVLSLTLGRQFTEELCAECERQRRAARPRVAVLFADVRRGPYAALAIHPDRRVELAVYGEDEDATTYSDSAPVVSHVPCGPWGRLFHLCGPELLAQRHLGPIAVEQVRRHGGVLEHPVDSKLWAYCGMPRPGELPDAWGGYTIRVEQWWWGHRAVKPTWLYIVGTFDVPRIPSRPESERPAGGGTRARRADPKRRSMTERLPSGQRHLTPPAFAVWLVDLASRCSAPVLEGCTACATGKGKHVPWCDEAVRQERAQRRA